MLKPQIRSRRAEIEIFQDSWGRNMDGEEKRNGTRKMSIKILRQR